MGSVHEVIEAFRQAPSNSERGTKFENLMVRYFELDPTLSKRYTLDLREARNQRRRTGFRSRQRRYRRTRLPTYRQHHRRHPQALPRSELYDPSYRDKYAADLKKMLPHIPTPESRKGFERLADASRKLAELHVNYEDAEPYPLDMRLEPAADPAYRETWRVEKMKWRSNQDHSGYRLQLQGHDFRHSRSGRKLPARITLGVGLDHRSLPRHHR